MILLYSFEFVIYLIFIYFVFVCEIVVTVVYWCLLYKPTRSFVFVLSQVHAYIISSLKKDMPSVFGKDNKKKELINSLGEIYSRIEREHQISPGDFPNLKKMQVRSIETTKTDSRMLHLDF